MIGHVLKGHNRMAYDVYERTGHDRTEQERQNWRDRTRKVMTVEGRTGSEVVQRGKGCTCRIETVSHIGKYWK